MENTIQFTLSFLGNFQTTINNMVNISTRFPEYKKSIQREAVVPNGFIPVYLMRHESITIAVKPIRIDIVFKMNPQEPLIEMDKLLDGARSIMDSLEIEAESNVNRIAINTLHFFKDQNKEKLQLLTSQLGKVLFGGTLSEFSARFNSPVTLDTVLVNDIVNIGYGEIANNSFVADAGIIVAVDCNTAPGRKLTFSLDAIFELFKKMASIVYKNVDLISKRFK